MTTFDGPASDSAVGEASELKLLGHSLFSEHFGFLWIIIYIRPCDIIDQYRIVVIVLPDQQAVISVGYHVNIIWFKAVVKPGSICLIDCNFYRFKSAFLRVAYYHFHC